MASLIQTQLTHYPRGAPAIRLGQRIPWCGRTPLTVRHAADLASQRAEELGQRVWILDADGEVVGSCTPP